MQYDIPALQSYVNKCYKDQIATGQIREVVLEPYTYVVSVAALVGVGGVAAPQQVNIQANADFLCLGVNHRAQLNAAQTVSSKVAPFVRMLVIDQGSGKQWTNSPVDLELYSSNDAKMRVLTYPRLVLGRSGLQVQLTGWAQSAETYALDITFDGLNVWTM